MHKRLNKITISTLLTVIIVLSTSLAVFASSATSASKTVTVGSYTYTYYSDVYTYNAYAYADAWVKANTTVPTGYMGTKALLYNSSGSLKKSTNYIYTSSASAQMGTITDFYLVLPANITVKGM